MHTPNMKNFIHENSHLFWWVPDQKKKELSLNAIVEQVLNYGDENNVKALFDLLGVEHVAQIFYRQIASPRCNYFPQVINFFTLYFQRHVQKDSHNRAD